ncbi:Maf family protein [Gulosibacter molinativorax]|uniref:Nucleoside triphosphate pyrophosphatase n=1 Tax=Gulosibacter molinativorax TaxID=256821 RepID=A0ABT7C802_9MICO|nr:nucleoside triphosphate pyrophosphatase [Gulosibacter molinativorax]MDJ1371335.1 septum formation inhibitor Maf [Gulosibacter molinativorax]QUY63601.1 Maf-like protein maf [Gulosibacter molinativorax]
MRLILASTSPARLDVLRNAGIEPVVRPSSVDEDAVLASNGPLTPAETVLTLARAKALAVADGEERDAHDGLVLGGDSMFEIDGEIYGKPGSPEVARERWEMQRGRTGTLWSGHWLVDRTVDASGHVAADEGVGAVKSAEVTFVDDLSDYEIEQYISSGEPLWVAGAFTIDSLGGAFIERISGDPSTVIGISLPVVRNLTRQLGYDWPALWNRPGAAS